MSPPVFKERWLYGVAAEKEVSPLLGGCRRAVHSRGIHHRVVERARTRADDGAHRAEAARPHGNRGGGAVARPIRQRARHAADRSQRRDRSRPEAHRSWCAGLASPREDPLGLEHPRQRASVGEDRRWIETCGRQSPWGIGHRLTGSLTSWPRPSPAAARRPRGRSDAQATYQPGRCPAPPTG